MLTVRRSPVRTRRRRHSIKTERALAMVTERSRSSWPGSRLGAVSGAHPPWEPDDEGGELTSRASLPSSIGREVRRRG
jgi:hypothetical protein